MGTRPWPVQPRSRTLRPTSPVAAAALTLLVYGGFVLASGVRRSPDTLAYSQAADRLIATGFDYLPVIEESQSMYPPVLYALFATVVVLLKLLLGGFWEVGLVALNLASAVAVATLVETTARRATGSAAASWCAITLCLVCYDLVVWVPFLLSDITFLMLAFAIFALCVHRIVDRTTGWAPVFALAVVATFYRATGVVLVGGVAWAWYLARGLPGVTRRMAAAAVAGTTVAGVLLFAWFVQEPSRWPLQALSAPMSETARHYAMGEVVWGRPATFHAPPVSLLDYAAITADRMIHFFAITTEGFSVRHTLANTLFFVPVYALIGVLGVAILRGKDGLSQTQRDIFLAAAGFVFVTAVFHGLLQVDYDWRYRTPILPHLILLAAGGGAVLSRRLART